MHYNPECDRYEIHGVVGPDEFHERYPRRRGRWLRNNACTNLMVAWIAGTAPRLLDLNTMTELEGYRRLRDHQFPRPVSATRGPDFNQTFTKLVRHIHRHAGAVIVTVTVRMCSR